MRLLLGIPPEPVEMQAVAVRYAELEGIGAERDYLIGVHIKGMSDAHRARYLRLLRSLAVKDVE